MNTENTTNTNTNTEMDVDATIEKAQGKAKPLTAAECNKKVHTFLKDQNKSFVLVLCDNDTERKSNGASSMYVTPEASLVVTFLAEFCDAVIDGKIPSEMLSTINTMLKVIRLRDMLKDRNEDS